MAVASTFVLPAWTHRLAVALRFVEAFTGTVIRSPLEVSMQLPPTALPPAGGSPSLLPPNNAGETRWRAARHPADDTYRFFLSNQLFGAQNALPPGLYDVTVVAPNRDYVNHEVIQVQLPRPRTAPPPPAIRSDFLVERRLWPTRRKPLPPGETAVIGRVVRPGGVPASNFRVALFVPPQAGPVPPEPYTRTDAAGDFVFRFPQRQRIFGNPLVVLHDFEVRDATNAVVPVLQPPAGSIPVEIGRVTAVEFRVP